MGNGHDFEKIEKEAHEIRKQAVELTGICPRCESSGFKAGEVKWREENVITRLSCSFCDYEIVILWMWTRDSRWSRRKLTYVRRLS